MADDAILTLNAGSSSLKFAAYLRGADGLALHSKGQVEGIGTAPHLIARDAGGKVLAEQRWSEGERQTHEDFLAKFLGAVEPYLGDARLVGVGHRIVHGGTRFIEPVRVTPEVMESLEALVPLAPLHQPHNLAAIRAVAKLRPGLAQIACFDTAFHHGRADLTTRIPLPRALADEAAIRRYGFHGISYEYLAGALRERAPELARGRVIAAHLGNGASLCAMRDGSSVDTTMGFTALDGLVMGTRPGALDPGVVLYLMQQRGMSAAEVETLLYKQSGLLGVSGISSDMRALTTSDDPRAREAVALFCFRAAWQAGGLAVSLGGLDGVVFSAGIGEHAPEVRASICAHLAWLGIELDEPANRAGRERISTEASRVQVWVIPTDEEVVIARAAARLLASA
jgi:acetate kinase